MQPLLMARLTAPIAAVSLILLAIAIGAAWYIRNTQEAVTGLMKDHARSVQAAQGLETTLQQIQVHSYQQMNGGKVVPAGEGDGDIESILTDAYQSGYRGFLSMEPHLKVAGHSHGETGADLFKVAADALKDVCRRMNIPLAGA